MLDQRGHEVLVGFLERARLGREGGERVAEGGVLRSPRRLAAAPHEHRADDADRHPHQQPPPPAEVVDDHAPTDDAEEPADPGARVEDPDLARPLLDRPVVGDQRESSWVGGLGDAHQHPQEEEDGEGRRETLQAHEQRPQREHAGEHAGAGVTGAEERDRDRADGTAEAGRERHRAEGEVADVEGVLQALGGLRKALELAALEPVGEAQGDHREAAVGDGAFDAAVHPLAHRRRH